MYCKKCGSQMDDTAIMCPDCGAPTDNYIKNKKEKPKSSTTRLALGIISCVLFLLITLQSCAAGLGNALEGNGESSGFAGLMLALCMLAAGIVGICTKRTKGGGIAAGLIYAFGGIVGIFNVGSYADLEIWSYLAFLLAVIFIISSIMMGRSNKDKETKQSSGKEKDHKVSKKSIVFGIIIGLLVIICIQLVMLVFAVSPTA